jgi:hypothetical protein
MIVCDTFVFLHLHKSGGTFVNHMMIKCLSSARRVGYHLPYSQIPDSDRHLPVLGTVRNPWAYYVSWYHFQQSQAKPNPLFRICSEDRSLDFSGTIRNLVTLQENDALVDQLVSVFPDDFVNYGLNLRKQCIDKIRGSGVGFYTFLYDRLYAGAEAPTILKMEELRQALFRLPLDLSPPESALVTDFLRSVPKLNVSEHRDYQDYYSPDLKALVERMDAPLIESHGYTY